MYKLPELLPLESTSLLRFFNFVKLLQKHSLHFIDEPSALEHSTLVRLTSMERCCKTLSLYIRRACVVRRVMQLQTFEKHNVLSFSKIMKYGYYSTKQNSKTKFIYEQLFFHLKHMFIAFHLVQRLLLQPMILPRYALLK